MAGIIINPSVTFPTTFAGASGMRQIAGIETSAAATSFLGFEGFRGRMRPRSAGLVYLSPFANGFRRDWSRSSDSKVPMPFKGAPTVVTPIISVSGSAAEAFSASGSPAVPADSVSASGAESFGATGAPQYLTSASGAGTETLSGTGAPSIATATSGAGQEALTGSGSAVAPSFGGAGAAAEEFDATGSPAVPVATVTSSGFEAFAASGNVTLSFSCSAVGAASIAGTGAVSVVGFACSAIGALDLPYAPAALSRTTEIPIERRVSFISDELRVSCVPVQSRIVWVDSDE